ncbi:sphingomyelin phosphodiesterase 5-like isoform X1 [Elephas maximus indicus]|uniref:sphingomyelin phosphodiesterase 5-like isoform X1 n=1 Tax=Elephas maximus indicus TaxID=99487 RepID=UPI0021170BEB|nr:sphingomyelin phosphodiesterase 5-like isoform X1 [Elephas maximus indicus]
MQSPPDWPPAPGSLRPSPFPHPVLHALHGLARALLFPAYWALDQLLGYWAPATRSGALGRLSAAAGAGAALLLLLISLPLALPGLLLWLPLQAWRRPFCYQPPPQSWAPPAPWRPHFEPARCFGFLSANLCLLPDGLARFSNLPHSQRRAQAVGAALLAGLRSSRYGATDCSPPPSGTPRGVLAAAVPAGLDFVCLQEVFDLRAARLLVRRLAPNLGPVLYDVGALGLRMGPHLKLLGSGLLLASRFPLLRAAFRSFPNGRREDALASKGLLSAQAQLGNLDGRRIVGFLHCTHLHAPSGEPAHSHSVAAAGPNADLHLLNPFPLVHHPRRCKSRRVPGWVHGPGPGRERRPRCGSIPGAKPSLPADDGPVRCKQLGLLLDWAEQFETESRQGGEEVAFSVLLGDLNFDNCSQGDSREQKHQLFSRFQDPCRLGVRREQPWALGTLLSTPVLHQSEASSPEMLRRALEQEEGRRLYLAGHPRVSCPAEPWRGRRLDYILYRGVPGAPLSPEVEQVTFSTALAGLTDHLVVGLRLRVSAPL